MCGKTAVYMLQGVRHCVTWFHTKLLPRRRPLGLCSADLETIPRHYAKQVYETIKFSARLRLPQMSSKEIEERVNEIIASFGLTHVKSSLIGNHLLRGISGGERRRVSIAVEVRLLVLHHQLE